jgi:hypothetical protein
MRYGDVSPLITEEFRQVLLSSTFVHGVSLRFGERFSLALFTNKLLNVLTH